MLYVVNKLAEECPIVNNKSGLPLLLFGGALSWALSVRSSASTPVGLDGKDLEN
jgi:hypothetical protein